MKARLWTVFGGLALACCIASATRLVDSPRHRGEQSAEAPGTSRAAPAGARSGQVSDRLGTPDRRSQDEGEPEGFEETYRSAVPRRREPELPLQVRRLGRPQLPLRGARRLRSPMQLRRRTYGGRQSATPQACSLAKCGRRPPSPSQDASSRPSCWAPRAPQRARSPENPGGTECKSHFTVLEPAVGASHPSFSLWSP